MSFLRFFHVIIDPKFSIAGSDVINFQTPHSCFTQNLWSFHNISVIWSFSILQEGWKYSQIISYLIVICENLFSYSMITKLVNSKSILTYLSFSYSLIGASYLSLLGGFVISLGSFIFLSLSLLRDLLQVEFVGEFLLVNSGSKNKHNSNDEHSWAEDNQVVEGGICGVMNSELEVSPPMETLEDVEKNHHSNDFKPILWGVLIH